MNKLEGFQYRRDRAKRIGVCAPVPDPYDDSAYRHRCRAYNNAFNAAMADTPEARAFRQGWRDRDAIAESGYCLDAPL